MRLLYLYPEEWSGRRAREVHTLSTCVALAQEGCAVTLVTAGGADPLRRHLHEVADSRDVPGLTLVALSRSVGPIRSAALFALHFRRWLRKQPPFDRGFIIHLKAAALLHRAGIPYLYEAHEIFSETPQRTTSRQRRLENLERQVLGQAAIRVATSAPLAAALRECYPLPDDFAIVPNAGLPPLEHTLSQAGGPFVYCGSIAGWKGLAVIIAAAREACVPLKIVGGTRAEWQRLGNEIDLREIAWQPRVALGEIPQALAGARAGLIATEPASPSGHYSCPMKLFDYARCGLPVLTTPLPSLQSLDVGSWCTTVSSSPAGWTTALQNFRHNPAEAEEARTWAQQYTWQERAKKLLAASLKTPSS